MRVIAVKTLRDFWEQSRYGDSEQPLKAWFREVKKADWASPADVKATFRQASIISDNRVIFNIAGNKYRLLVKINYRYRTLYIRFIGTHGQYDSIDVEKV